MPTTPEQREILLSEIADGKSVRSICRDKDIPERSVYYDGLTKTSAAELVSLGEALGMQALQTVNRRALTLEQKDADRPDANQRINFGIYFYHTTQDQNQTEQTDNAPQTLSKSTK